MYEILNKINSPEDVKKLNLEELNLLANDIREALFNRLTKVGGHFGPNFGVVELEIAMHYVFSSPIDKFVFDVSHQAYPHKMLTGRKNGYIIDECFSEDSGYTNPDESIHDLFNIGHTSTSISLATGLAKARDLLGGRENVIAVIGDGSLSGGEALEGLNVAGSEIKSNLIIIVNDNDQSISEVHGGIYKSLRDLRKTNGKSENNIFKAFGLDYMYLHDGNNIEKLIDALNKVKDINHPIVLHINTIKGLGYDLAIENKEQWHWCMPFDRKTGKPKFSFDGQNYTDICKDWILNRAKIDDKFCVITPNMPMSFNLGIDERIELGSKFVDCGIAEEQAVAMAAGMAKRGANPLVITNMTFMQRVYDQMSHDVCINNLPAVFLTNFNAFDGLTDVTHLGIFGLPLFINIPNLVVLAPTSKEELIQMLDYAITQKEHPILILQPGNSVSNSIPLNNYHLTNTYEVTKLGEKIAIIALGDFYQLGESLYNEIQSKLNITPTLINPRFASGLDKELLTNLKNNHDIVITLEDGVLDGGFGEKISRFYSLADIKVLNYGLEKLFYDRYNPSSLLNELGITNEKIIKKIKDLL